MTNIEKAAISRIFTMNGESFSIDFVDTEAGEVFCMNEANHEYLKLTEEDFTNAVFFKIVAI